MAEQAEKLDEQPADAAEGAEGATEEAGDGKKKSSKKMLILIGVGILVVLLGGGAGAFFTGAFDAPVEGEAGAEGEHAEAPVDPNKPPVYYNVPDMIVNLQAERNRPVFLKISMSLELAKDTDVPAVERVLPRVIDNFQVYLRELRVDELRGSAGMYRLREELLMRVNQAVAPIKVKDVLFREMLVQ